MKDIIHLDILTNFLEPFCFLIRRVELQLRDCAMEKSRT